MYILIGLLAGIAAAIYAPITIPATLSTYMGVAILACFDGVFGGINARNHGKFKSDIFFSGFFGNALLAIAITYLGTKLGIPLYLAPVVIFGSRLFNNFAKIRRSLLNVDAQSYTISESEMISQRDIQL